MTAKRKKTDKLYANAKAFRQELAAQTEKVIPPQSLQPQYIEQIITRGENLSAMQKAARKKQKRQKRPMLYKAVAVALSLLLVVGLGSYAIKEQLNRDKLQTLDVQSGDHTTAKTASGDILDGTGMLTVAQYYEVLADDYAPLTSYAKELKQKVEQANQKTLFETLTEAVDEAMDFGFKAEDSATSADGSANLYTMAGDYSDTNNQVQDVQEGDIIKTNGAYVLVLSATGELVCQKVDDEGSLQKTDALMIGEADNATLQEMFLYQNQIAVVGQTYDESHDHSTKVYLYQYNAEGILEEVGSYMQKGSYVSGRVAKGALYIVTDQYAFSVYRDGEEENVPLVWSDGISRQVTTEEIYIAGCPSYSMSYTNITGHVFGEMPENVNTVSILGSSASEIYSTSENLYLICTNDYYNSLAKLTGESVGRSTSIYSYTLKDGVITAKAQGEVEGWTLNQFSADEYNGYFRIATSDNNACRVTVLDDALQQVSQLKDLAEGERIYACKFMENTAYLVTFYETDPLFVIDLSDVKAPKVLGELKLPGYSSYLYPFGEDYLIGVGMNADEYGSVNGLRVNLFDVSDPCDPKLSDVKILYGDGSILAAEDHKAYYADAQNGLFGFPLHFYQNGYESFDGFVLFAVENGKLAVKKELNFLSDASQLSWDKEYRLNYAYNNHYIKRAIYVGNTLYLLSNDYLYAYGRNDFAYLNVFDLD